MKHMIILWVALLGAAASPGASQDAVGVAKTSENGLRRLATDAPKPVYPVESLKANKTGVAVAQVIVETDGRPTVEVLEAPDEHIAAGVKIALSRWTFKPLMAQGSVYRAQARLTFYFRIDSGKGIVLNPDEMPGGAEKPKPAPTTGATPLALGPAPFVTPNDIVVGSITFDEFSKLTGAARPTVLDVGDRTSFKRGHQPGAINIPLDEMIVRGPIELGGLKFVVIDCTQEELWKCKFAAHYLEGANVGRLALLQR